MSVKDGWCVAEAAGDWAVVTGASSGLGRAYARALAEAGMNVVVVARRRERLEQLGRELTVQNKARIEIVESDLGCTGAAERLRAYLEEKQIVVRLLCNNAAVGRHSDLAGMSSAEVHRMIDTNIRAVTELCRVFAGVLATHETSALVNVASPAAIWPMPGMAVYAASKAFVASLSLSLYGELRGRGVVVQTLYPGPMATELEGSDILGERYRPAAWVVRRSLAGLAKARPIVDAAGSIGCQRCLAALLPPRLLIRAVGRRLASGRSATRQKRAGRGLVQYADDAQDGWPPLGWRSGSSQ